MPIRIRRPQSLTTGNIILGCLMGIASGYYIYNKPLLDLQRKKLEENSGETTSEDHS